MKTNRLVVTIILVFMLLLTNSNIALAQSIPEVELVEQSDPGVVQVVRVYYESIEDIELLVPFDLFEYNNLEEKYVLVAVNARELGELKDLGFKVVIDEEETAKFTFLPSSGENQLNTIPSFPCYRTVEETYAAAAALAVNYPNLATWIDVGESWQKAIGPLPGYDMMVLKLTNSAIVGQKPVLFITASIHAREYAPAEIATRFAEYLVNNYGIDPDVTWMLDYQEVHIMFHANPDGRKIAETGSSWRKNRDNDDGCSTTYGVDLNRNFTYQWGTGGSSTNPCDETYRGPSAGSEPETQAIQAYISSVFIDQRGTGAAPADAQGVYIDMHSSGGYVMWPWGYTTTTPPNNTQLQTMGRKLAYFNGYTPGQITRVLYVASGGSVDYAYGEMGVATYAFEVGTAFFQACSSFESTVYPTNLNALLYATKVTRTPYMTPLGPDSLNLALSANSVPAGTSVTLTATANDTRYKSGTGEATQAIAAAEYYLDIPPWVAGATAFPMGASDGTFNSTTENITVSVNTTGWSNGRHTLYIRSKDAANNWGAVSAIFLTVEGQANLAPVISQGDSVAVTMSEDGNPVSFAVAIDAVDPEGDPMTWTLSGLPSQGNAVVSGTGASPAVLYTPSANYNGTDSFVVQVSDGNLNDTITVNVTIQPVNDPPVANGQSVSTPENTAKVITLTGTDIDGDTLTYSIVTGPSHGSLSGTGSSQTYTPAANYNGSDSFTFKINDGSVDSNTATVDITVTAVNDAPVADGQSVTTAEDTAMPISLTGSDADGDPLTYIIVGQPVHGTLSGSVPNVTYTPTANFNGSDSFTFKVNDGTVDSNTATVTITVTPVNDAPVAIPQNIGTNQDTPVSITLSGSDIDADPLTYTVSASPTHGTLSSTAPNLTYTPNTGYVGADSFEFTVSDGTAISSPATVSISVSNVNDAPVADGQSLSTPEDTSLSITLSGSDADDDPLTYRVITQPVHGTLTGTAATITYAPEANYNGTDAFIFVANDGTVDSPPATVTIDITPVNDAPIANGQAVVTSENAAVEITLTGTDVENSALTFSIQSGPSNGTLTGSGAAWTYQPDADYEGADLFTFIANDGELDSALATVSITVTRTNEPPVADEQTVSTNEDVALGVTLTGSDPDNDPITYAVFANPSHGTLSGTAPNLTYTPDENYHGSDSFSFVVNDGLVDSAEVIIAITVVPVNDAPVADSQSVTVVEDTATEITLSGSDIDGDALTYTIVTGPSHGSLSGTGSTQTYTPAANYNGLDSFTFNVNDGTVDSNIATVTITVTAVNDAPVADSQSVITAEDTAVEITLTGSDVEANPLTYSIVTPPTHGTLSGSAPNVTYTPAANYNGPDSFTFRVYDGQTNSAPATVSITITPVNDAPIAIPQTLSVDEDAAVNIVLAGSDVDGDALTYIVVTGPAHGTLSGTVPNLVYTPIANYYGDDAFTFTVGDGTFVSPAAIIDMTIRPVNDPPVAEGQAITTSENTPVAITLEGSDIDGDDLSYIISAAPLQGELTGTLPNLTYTPFDYYSGNDVFSFYVNDGISNSNSAEVTILILDINYLPIVYNQTVSTNENSPLAILLTGMDPDGDVLSFFTITPPEHGILTGIAPNLVYTPDPGYTGSDLFTFGASDQEGNSNEGVISIQVNPSGPLTVFFDDFETNLGWIRNPYGTDTATLGWFERANPESVAYYGDKQLGTTISGSYDLVTGPLVGSSAGSYDLDGGKTSMLSPLIELPVGRDLEMSFSYYVAHYTNSSTADYLRVYIIGENTVKIFEELGANNDDDAVWEVFNENISSFAGQTIRILIEAADASTASYFEAAVDDVFIEATTPNNPPAAVSQSYEMTEDTNLGLTLAGSDPDGDDVTFSIVTLPSHGALSGQAPDLTYTPSINYNGFDSFSFIVSDGKLNSETATISIDIAAVNDAPVALEQFVSTQVDVRLDILLSGTDVDGDVLQFNITSFPSHGTLTGFVPNLIYIPDEGFVGDDSFTFVVFDGIEESRPATVSIQVNPAGPMTIFWDDFETDQGWIIDPFNSDTATIGTWERANPETVSYYGYKQLGKTVSGSYDLVTGPLAGSSAGSYDLDGGLTSIRSPQITLPTGRDITLSFSYYLAHYTNSSTADYLRIKIVGSATTTLFQELGANNDDDASWSSYTANLNNYAGQTVYLLIEAADASTASFVEAAIDDVLIIAE